MVSTRNMSRSQANPPRVIDQHDADNDRQYENIPETDPPMGNPPINEELAALRQANERLVQQNEELMKLLQRPQEAQRAQGGQYNPPRREQQHLDPLREADERGENSQALGEIPHQPFRDVHN